MKNKIVILGHRGFIGNHLYHHFLNNPNFETLGLSSKEVNLLDKEQVENFSLEIDEKTVLVFCAAIPRAKQDDAESFLKNVIMVNHVAQVLKRHPPRQCLFLSSIDVYGTPTQGPIDEATSPVPDSYYGWAKYTAEFLLQKALSDQKTVLTILRLSGVYGRGKKLFNPINIWMESAIEKGQIDLFGDGSEQRDYIWLEDVYPLFCRMIDKKVGGIFNIATGQSYTLLEVIGQLKKIIPRPFEAVRSERKRPWLNYQFNTNALQEAIGPFSWVPLAQGLKSLYASFSNP